MENAEAWTVAEVGDWLISNDLENYVKFFEKEGIDGEALLFLSATDIQNNMAKAFKLGERIKLLKKLDKLRNQRVIKIEVR